MPVLNNKRQHTVDATPGPGAYYLETMFNVSIFLSRGKKESPSSVGPNLSMIIKKNPHLGLIFPVVHLLCRNHQLLRSEKKGKLKDLKMHQVLLTIK